MVWCGWMSVLSRVHNKTIREYAQFKFRATTLTSLLDELPYEVSVTRVCLDRGR